MEALPTYDELIEPLLRYLSHHPAGVSSADAADALADRYTLSPELRAVKLSSGKSKFADRTHWAHDRLKRAGYSESISRGIWRLTEQGKRIAARYSSGLPKGLVNKLAKNSPLGRLRPLVETSRTDTVAPTTPEDDLRQALKRYHDAVLADLLERVRRAPLKSFRNFVYDLLKARGFEQPPDKENFGFRVEGAFVSRRLGDKRIYVVATQLSRTVGIPRVRALQLSMEQQGLNQGLLVSTAEFNKHAREYASSAPGLELLGGKSLACEMVEHGIGALIKSERVALVNKQYFQGER